MQHLVSQFLWKKNIKYTILLLTLVLLPSQIFAESIRIGYFIVSPHVIKKKEGGLTGAYVEFFEKKIAPEMGVKVIWQEMGMSISRQLIELQKNRIDAGLVFAKNPEREKIVYYPESFFFESSPLLVLLG